MKQEKDCEFGGEMCRLERKLRRADFSGESLVKDTLKRSLIDREERPRRRVPALAWLVPAAVAAALLVVFAPRHRKAAPAAPEAVSYASAYSLPDDGYGACGRMGLGEERPGESF